MYKTSEDTQRRKDAKKQFILNTAANVFGEKGYHNTTVKDIVDEAAVSVGSFYFYFKGKEELFTELYQDIVKKFQKNAESIIDIEKFSLVKNFTRLITANLWLYQQHRELAKIMLLEAVAINPEFRKIRAESIHESSKTMAAWFKRFKTNHPVNIPDERTAALIYEGTFYYVIDEWLESETSVPLTDSSYALCVYNLQALKIPFEDEAVRDYIQETLNALNNR